MIVENRQYQICTRCIMDTSDPDIVFDDKGVCNHCKQAEKLLQSCSDKKAVFNMDEYLNRVKNDGIGKEYDCIIGVSGGVDSSYVLYYLKKNGLRPLAVHFDNGWNSELAVQNIRILLEKLDVDLYTYVVNWQEFKDLQLSFLKASTPDSEIPTDHMIYSILPFVAHEYGIKHIIMGNNMSSESILPPKWSYGHHDWKYIKSVHKQYGTIPLKTYVYKTRLSTIYFAKKIEWLSILDYLDYDKEKAKQMLIEDYGWRDYGGKHYESFYTKLYQSYILPRKFGFDKRRAHYSSLIVAGQLTRDEAIEKMKEALYNDRELARDIEFFVEKMDIMKEDFDEIMNKPCLTYMDYKNYENDLLGSLIKKINHSGY